MNSSNQNPKSSVPCVIVIVNEVKEKSDNKKRKNIEKDFFKITPTTKCYKCQGYGHVAANCPSSFKIAINGVFIEAPKPDSTISLKVTPIIKEFTVNYTFPLPVLLSTPRSPPLLLPTPTIITCFFH